jgi:hypothetical protein
MRDHLLTKFADLYRSCLRRTNAAKPINTDKINKPHVVIVGTGLAAATAGGGVAPRPAIGQIVPPPSVAQPTPPTAEPPEYTT